jgi:hypothetical protein
MSQLDNIMALVDDYGSACYFREEDHPKKHKALRTAIEQMEKQEPVAQPLKEAVFTVLEGFTLPHDVRKILESAYFTTPPTTPAAYTAEDIAAAAARVGWVDGEGQVARDEWVLTWHARHTTTTSSAWR